MIRKPGHGLSQRPSFDTGPEGAVVGPESWQSSQGAQISLLSLALRWIAWPGVQAGGEIADTVDAVPRKEGLGKLPQIKPTKWGVF